MLYSKTHGSLHHFCHLVKRFSLSIHIQRDKEQTHKEMKWLVIKLEARLELSLNRITFVL